MKPDNKPLEKIIKELNRYIENNEGTVIITIDYLIAIRNEFIKIEKETIPKSKVREKIEEYNIPIFDILDKIPMMPKTIEKGMGAKDGIIYVLQELLQEGR